MLHGQCRAWLAGCQQTVISDRSKQKSHDNFFPVTRVLAVISVSRQLQGEVKSVICKVYLSVAARSIVYVDLTLIAT